MATNHANSGALGFEDKLWAAADRLRGHVDPAEYKHVVLGLIFLKYIADAFQTLYDKLAATPYAGLRDTLLPKLISGELHIPAAAEIVEGVAS